MSQQLIDSYGRVHRDLRISVTDRCNFRCTYCMPEEGLDWLARDQLLDFEEITRIARVAVERFGIDSIRLTGGEPLVRHDLAVLVNMLADLDVDVALTTNGATLVRHIDALVNAGLRRINISLDSLNPTKFEALTRRDELDHVLAGIDAAVRSPLDPVKVNMVAMRGINDDEIVDFARFGRERDVEVRFIEWMPLDADEGWSNERVVAQDEIVQRIGETFPLEPIVRGSEPAQRFRYLDGVGTVGVIGSVSHAFCGSCDRLRLTSEGQLRNCLFALAETDLRSLLRSGGSDDDIADAIVASIAAKWAGHQIGQVTFIRPSRSMSQIGG